MMSLTITSKFDVDANHFVVDLY